MKKSRLNPMRTGPLLAAWAAVLGSPLFALASEPPGSIRHFRSDTMVEADGQAVQMAHYEIAVNNDAAAR